MEKIRHGHVIAVSARTRSKTITVGGLTVVVPAGEKVKVSIGLNATGAKLLRHFHKLPAHLSAILEGEGKERHTVIAQNLTIKPRKKHRR